MYLSRVEIDTGNRQKIKDLTHLGAYHNWVEEAFPEEFKNKERTRKLWRIDRLAGKDYLILLSREKPDIENLERYGVIGSAKISNYDYFLDALRKGQRARFKIKLNPVVSIKDKGKERGRIVPLKQDKYKEYLIDRSLKNGFSLEEDEFGITSKGTESFKKQGQKEIKLVKAVYEGVLTIEDTEKFRKMLTNGIGKKKAYGFGLMTIIPID